MTKNKEKIYSLTDTAQKDELNNLEKMIRNDLVTDIKMPIENINKWKNQFK